MIEAEVTSCGEIFVVFIYLIFSGWCICKNDWKDNNTLLFVRWFEMKWNHPNALMVMLIYWEFMNKAGIGFHSLTFCQLRKTCMKRLEGTWLFSRLMKNFPLSEKFIKSSKNMKNELCIYDSIIIAFFVVVLFKSDSFNNSK